MAWGKSARAFSPVDVPRVRCWACAWKDELIARLEAENRRLSRELIDAAADAAVAEGAPER